MPRTDVDRLIGATTAAATLAMTYFRAGVTPWDKVPGHPVSEADLAVDALLKTTLLSGTDDGWLSEETADDPVRLARRRVWVVDPIDGTRDFIRARSGWAVSVALVEDGVVTMGALAAPVREQLFVAVRGEGATLNGAPMRVSGRAAFAGCALPVDAATLGAAFWPVRWDAIAVEKPNSLALRVAHVARGVADGFIEGRTIAEWDIAAAALILTEAGGHATDRDGATLRFNQPVPAVRGFVGATPAIHGDLRERLAGGLAVLAAARSKRTI